MKLNIRELKARAAELTAENRVPARQLVLWYCGVVAVLTLGSSGLNLYLDSQISSTGGLSGIGLRSVLQTIQEILNLVNQFFGPFWSAGFLFAMMSMVRGNQPQCRDLTEGFRRFFRVLGHACFQFMVAVLVLTAAGYLGSIIYALSPLGARLTAELGPILTDPNLITPEGMVNLELIPADTLAAAALPLALITAALFLPMYIWLSYGFRLSLYLVIDRSIGAFQAHFLSLRLMKGHKWSMLKLDLSYWWYYLLTVLFGVVGYLDLILGILGVPLPMDETVMFFATMAAYCVLVTGLSLWKKCQVDASYVLAYEAIAHPEPVEIPIETQ